MEMSEKKQKGMSKRGRKEKKDAPEEDKKKPKLIDAMAAQVPVVKLKEGESSAELRRRQKIRDQMVFDERCIVVRRIATETPDREQWSDKLLRWECEMLGLASDGIRPILLQRLANHRAGKAVMRTDHQHYVSVSKEAATAARAVAGDKEQVILRLGNGRGEEGFLALPHELIRGVLLPLVDPFSLICLARTCKYLHKDVTGEIWIRAKKMFGPGGSAKALAGFMYLATRYRSQSPLVPSAHKSSYAETWELTTGHGRAAKERAKEFGVLVNNLPIGTNDRVAKFVHDSFPFVSLPLIDGHYMEATIIAQCIVKYGDVDMFLTQKRLRKERAELLSEERKVLALTANKRLKAINALIGIDIFRIGLDGSDQLPLVYSLKLGHGPLLSLTPVGLFMYSLNGSPDLVQAHRKCTRHVYEAVPKTAKAAAKVFTDLFYDHRVLAFKTAVECGLNAENVRHFSSVFRFLVSCDLGNLNQCADDTALVRMGIDSAGLKQFVASACDIARHPDSRGLTRAFSPTKYLENVDNLTTGRAHCVVLCINTPDLKAFRIVYVPEKRMQYRAPPTLKELEKLARQRALYSKEVLEPLTADSERNRRIFTITPDSVFDALDPEMAVYLYGCASFKRELTPLFGQARGWSKCEKTLTFPVSEAGWTGVTRFGVYYRAEWQPYAPILCQLE